MKTSQGWLWKVAISAVALAMVGVAARADVISAGYYDSFGVKADNSLWGWGYDGGNANNYADPSRTQTVSVARAQLGLGTTNDMVTMNGAYVVASPTQSGTAKTWLDVVGGLYCGFGIQSDGSLWAWGYDGTPESTSLGSFYRYHDEQRGALGMGTQVCQVITSVYAPVTVSTSYSPPHDKYVYTDTYPFITNSVMNGLAVNQPTQVGSDKSWRQVAAGNDFGLGLQADGSIWSWGSESITTTHQYDTNGVVTAHVYQANGHLGQGDMLVTSTNSAGGEIYSRVTEHYTNNGMFTPYYLVDVTTNTLTNSMTTNVVHYVRALNAPTKITAPTSMDKSASWWSGIAAGQAHGAAIGSDGSLWTWGKNQGGTYVASVYVTNVNYYSNYWNHQLVPIYNTNHSVLGLGDTTLIATNVPAQVGSETNWASVSAGLNAQFTLAIKTDGSLWGWGDNGYAGANYYWLESGWSSYSDQNPSATNTSVFWTYAYGYLGLGSNTLFANIPMRVGTDNNWAMVSAGNVHCLGLKSDGSLYAWGNNGGGWWGGSDGRLGLGRSDTYVAVPTRVGADNDWVAVSAGFNHSLAMKSDGSLWAWGNNTYAALGDQSGNAYEPVKISDGWGYSAPVIAAAENGGGDYDGDGKTDFVVYDAATGNWLVRLSTMGYSLYSLDAMLGGPGYGLVTADFDGDGKTDPAVYQESTGTWLIKLSASGHVLVTLEGWLGGTGYTAVPADYDGDGQADPAVYNKSTGEWRMRLSGSAYLTVLKTLGAGCVPVPMDYDGDLKADLASYESATGNWQVMLSASADAVVPFAFGGCNYLAVPMDYDGDGKSDPAVYGEATGVWQIKLSAYGYAVYDSSVHGGWILGGTGYVPTPADYDGDGLADPTVYNSTTGQWTLMLSAYGYSHYTTTW